MAKESFLRGALILAIASTISRIVGLVYMVLLPRIILDSGMGLLQLVKPLYYFAAVLAISGMPVAASKLIAEKAAHGNRAGVFRVFWAALAILLTTGLLASIGMLALAPFFTEKIAKDPGVYYVILALAPGALMLAISGVFRGFFHGLQNMVPTAAAQVTDQVIRVSSTLLLAYWLMPRGIEYGAAGAALGSAIGEFSGVLVLLGFFLLQKNRLLAEVAPRTKRRAIHRLEGWRSIFGRLAHLAFPVVVATILWPVMQMLDTVLIPLRMEVAGFSGQQIRDWIGYLGMALTISQFPNVVTVALSTSLVPAISEAHAVAGTNLVRRRTEDALRIAWLFGLPAFVALLVLAEPISTMLFSYSEVGFPLRILAVGSLTLGLIQATTGILQGLGQVMVPVKTLAVGVLVKLVINWFFIALPQFGVLGAAWGTTFGWTTTALLNLGALIQRVGITIHVKELLIKPLLAAGLMAFFLFHGYEVCMDICLLYMGRGVANVISVLVSVAVSLSLYFLSLMSFGSVTSKDVEMIPAVGRNISDSLYRWGFLRR